MSLFGDSNKKPSLLMRILKVIYWIIFAIALVIVLVFIAFKIFVAKPDVGNNEIIINPDVVIQIPTTPQPSQNPSDPLVSQAPQESQPPRNWFCAARRVSTPACWPAQTTATAVRTL